MLCLLRLLRRRAVRPIPAGHEVTTSYTELAATRWERRRELLRHHLFDIDAEQGGAEAEGAAASGSAAGAAGGPSPAGSSAAGGASAAGAAPPGLLPSWAAAMQCLPAEPPGETLPLRALGGAGELRLYTGQVPPWPHDEHDVALTTVMGAGILRWGGMWGTLGQPDPFAAAAVPASASFDVGEAAAGHHAGAGGPGSAAAVPAVHCWLVPDARMASQHLLGLAEPYLAALLLQQALDAQLAAGHAAAAVQQLQRALQALTGGMLSLGPCHVLRMRLLADLHRAAVAAADWQVALAAAYDLLPLYQQAYEPVRALCRGRVGEGGGIATARRHRPPPPPPSCPGCRCGRSWACCGRASPR